MLWQKAKSGGSPILTLGAIRPDAELIKEWKRDSFLVADDEYTIPEYSTTEQTIEASGDYLSEDVILESVGTNYSYFLTFRGVGYPVYNTNEVFSGRVEYHCRFDVVEFRNRFRYPDLSGDLSNSAFVLAANFLARLGQTLVYVNSSFKITETSNGYGIGYTNNTSPIGNAVFNNDRITVKIKSPPVTCRGSTNYMNQDCWDAMTDARVQYIIQLWRAPRGNLNLDGWFESQLEESIISSMTSPTHKLV